MAVLFCCRERQRQQQADRLVPSPCSLTSCSCLHSPGRSREGWLPRTASDLRSGLRRAALGEAATAGDAGRAAQGYWETDGGWGSGARRRETEGRGGSAWNGGVAAMSYLGGAGGEPSPISERELFFSHLRNSWRADIFVEERDGRGHLYLAADNIRTKKRCGDGGEEEEDDMEKHAVQVLVLAHAYQVPWLKRACEGAIGARLTADSVVDVLQLADLCDAPRLHLRCARLLAKEFAAVERTEAWRFLQENDPWQELHVLERLHEADMRRRKWRRKREEQRVYVELSEAMDCLDHICTEGCTEVGPAGRAPAPAPCARYATCRGLQLLIRHFSQCHRKSCARCQRMWQLLRLHSALCDRPDRCDTPLCMRFKQKEQEKAAAKAGDDGDKWGLLVKKVKAARVFSSLANRKQTSTSTQC